MFHRKLPLKESESRPKFILFIGNNLRTFCLDGQGGFSKIISMATGYSKLFCHGMSNRQNSKKSRYLPKIYAMKEDQFCARTTRRFTETYTFQVTLPNPRTPAHESSFIPRTSQIDTLPCFGFGYTEKI